LKIAISSKGREIGSEIDPAFGRCHYFLVVEVNDGAVLGIEAVENKGAESAGMAGTNAVRLVAEKGAEAVITGRLGPRAMDALKQFKISAYCGEGLIKNAIGLFVERKLEKLC